MRPLMTEDQLKNLDRHMLRAYNLNVSDLIDCIVLGVLWKHLKLIPANN